MVWTNVLALPPRLAGIIPWRSTQNRSSVTPISRPMITTVTHHGTRPSTDSPISAAPVSALSAIGSAIVPNAVTRPRRRASSPSSRSVSAATANTPNAASRQPVFVPSSTNSATRNTGTSSSRTTVSTLAMFSSGGGPAGADGTRCPRVTRGRPRRGERRCGAAAHAARRRRSAPSVPIDDRRAPGRRRLEPGAALEHALAVDLGGLVRGPAGALEVLVLGRLDQHLTSVPIRSSARCAISSSTSAVIRSTRAAISSAASLPSIARGLGAVLVGVAEHADRVQPRLGRGTPPARPGPPRSRRGSRRSRCCGCRPRARARGSARTGRGSPAGEPKRRIRRSTAGLACWNDRSK